MKRRVKGLECRCGAHPFAEWMGDMLYLRCRACGEETFAVKKRLESLDEMISRVAMDSDFQPASENETAEESKAVTVL